MLCMLDDTPSYHCAACGATCHCVPIHHRDGRIEVEGYYCQTDGCRLRDRNQLHVGRPGVEVGFLQDWGHRFIAVGPPSRGEENVASVAGTFLFVLARDHGIKHAALKVWGKADAPRGVDAQAQLLHGYTLRMQVTRALPSSMKRAWAVRGEVEAAGSVYDAVDLLRDAIATKTKHYRDLNVDTSGITLLIDGMEAPHLAFPAPALFEPMHGDWARAQGWESIWVVGMSWAQHLSWTPSLPSSWKA